jgi:hypothetical protein
VLSAPTLSEFVAFALSRTIAIHLESKIFMVRCKNFLEAFSIFKFLRSLDYFLKLNTLSKFNYIFFKVNILFDFNF